MTETAGFQVLRGDTSHLDALAGLFDAYRRFYGQPSDPARAREFLAERLVYDQSAVFIALDGNGEAPLGFTQLYPLFSSVRAAPMWLLNDLYVVRAARGRGIGAALLERAREHARETGACGLMLETAVDNPARRLYERSGWQQVTDYVCYTLSPP